LLAPRRCRLPLLPRTHQHVRSTQVRSLHIYVPSPIHLAVLIKPTSLRFMDLDIFQLTYFANLVVTALTSLGVSPSDSSLIGTSLAKQFNTRCAAPISVPHITAPPELQSICIAPNCPLDPHSNCSAYPLDGVALAPVNVTTNVTVGSTVNETTSGNSTSSATPPQTSLGSIYGLNLGMALTLMAAAVVSFFVVNGGL
jgi:hypothetical protein